MAVIALKNPHAPLRQAIKFFKQHYDDPRLLERYARIILERLSFDRDINDERWRPEGFHMLALYRESMGDFVTAERYFIEAMSRLLEHENLALARVTRDYGRFRAEHYDVKLGLYDVEQALALHDLDAKNKKGRRQRRITESYLWYIRLLIDENDAEAYEALMHFALSGCQDCGDRDQERVVGFALRFANGIQKPLLDARLVQIKTLRLKPKRALGSLVKFCFDTEVFIAGTIARRLIRRE